jgi:type II secretory pathway predicted ATPase ExeA
MYHAHWGLRESPFRRGLDPQAFYQSPAHEEALARLYFLVEQRRRLGFLMGPAGSGKSLLLEVFAAQLRRSGRQVAKVNLYGLQPAEMLWDIAGQFGLNLDPSASPVLLWRAVADRLAEHRYLQAETVVLLDDADQASRPVLSFVTRLAEHEQRPEMRLTLVLAGEPERMGRLGPRLLDLSDLRVDLTAWQESDTAEFLRAALARAGRESPVFREPAVARLHELSQGIPRRVSQLADLALLAGAGRALEAIDADVVESVYRELGVIEV